MSAYQSPLHIVSAHLAEQGITLAGLKVDNKSNEIPAVRDLIGLLKHARAEWSVESMHWLLDVHFGEDFCRIEDEDVQQVLNAVRKIALRLITFVQNYAWLSSGLSEVDPCVALLAG